MDLNESFLLVCFVYYVVTLDLKGYQYHGIIHPGPTALVVVMGTKSSSLKVEAVTDEFVTLTQTQDVMARLDAVVQGNMEGYQVLDDNVNRGGGPEEKSGEINSKRKSASAPPSHKKRKTKK